MLRDGHGWLNVFFLLFSLNWKRGEIDRKRVRLFKVVRCCVTLSFRITSRIDGENQSLGLLFLLLVRAEGTTGNKHMTGAGIEVRFLYVLYKGSMI